MMNETDSLNTLNPLTVSVPRAAAMIGVSVYQIRNYVKAGRLRSTRLGTRLLVFTDSLRELVTTGAPKRTAKDFALASATA